MPDFVEIGNLVWWVLLGGGLIIGGVVFLILGSEKKVKFSAVAERVMELEENVELLNHTVGELRDKELARARRDILARERRAEKLKNKPLVLESDDQVDFYNNVRATIDEL